MKSKMRTCECCNGDGMVQDDYQCDGVMYCDDDIITGIVEQCGFCSGEGEVKDLCYCSAYCYCECACGYDWGDSSCYCWDY